MGHLLCTVLALLAGAAATARAPDRQPCAPGDPSYAEADRELEALNAAIQALPADGDPSLTIARVETLAGTRCFALLENGLSLDTRHALALKTYWEDGGYDHLRSYLDLGKRPRPYVYQPPALRKTMREVFPAGHPLESLVCLPTPSCGAETAGWRRRLEEVLDRASARGDSCRDDKRRSKPPSNPQECGGFAAKSSPRQRFRRFTECLAITQPRKEVLPLGRLRVPPDGWLTISGRRGHYRFCDEVRAFDLATGASFRVATCSGLVLQEGGSVDNRSTDRGRRIQIEVGQVPVAAVRETAWVLLLHDAIKATAADSVAVALPKNIAPVLGAGSFDFSQAASACSSSTFSSDQTSLSWRVQRQGQLLAGGKLTWPSDHNDEVDAHATSLLRIAEAGFVAGCPPATPPRGLFDEGLALVANKLDTDAASLRTADDSLTEAWGRAVKEAEACRAKLR